MTRPLFIQMMQGLGDACYQRPFVRAQGAVRPTFIDTAWPEIYSDLLGVHFVKPNTTLRTQAKHVARLNGFPWETAPDHWQGDRNKFMYVLVAPGSIAGELERHIGLAGQPFVFDLPDFGPPLITGRYAVIRPASVRTEWKAPARNPDPAYIADAARLLRAAGITVVCVADLDGEQEVLHGEMPEADHYFVKGELEPKALLALVKNAAVVVGGVGWIVPVCLAYRTPAVIIGGGLGHYNAPARVIDKRMDGSRMRFVMPDPYCTCNAPRHNCAKAIPDFSGKFTAALTDLLNPATEMVA